VLTVPKDLSGLSPAWMSAALARRYPGTVVRDLSIGPVGHGTNTRARVHLTLAGGDGPPSVFVKGPGRLTHRLALSVLGALKTEALLADSETTFPLEHPAFLGGGVDWRRIASVVVSEDVVAAGATPHDARAPLTVEAVRSGLVGLAALHAAFWQRSIPASLRHLRLWRLGPAWELVSVASLVRGLRRAADVNGAPLHLPSGVGALTLGRQYGCCASAAASGPRTVLHGDPHPGNVYTTASGCTGFFDWQLARLGHWSHDVGYFLVGSLDVDTRRSHERELLGTYLDVLARSGVCPSPPMEAAWDRYRSTPAYGLATWLHTLSFGTLQPVEVCMATIRRFAAAYEDLGTGNWDVSRS
jgi:Phosphotransferase enzyme family